MSQNTCWHRVQWRLATALILVAFLSLISPLPAAAQSTADYFQLSYDPVKFSKNKIQGSEIFSVTILGRATCTNDLPVSAGEASITSRVSAERTVSGARVTLNSSYTITIKPFPSKEGDTAEINQVVPLQFPAQAESGAYNVIGELIEAKVKVAFAWGEVTDYLPQSQLMGSLQYTAPEPTPTPTPMPPITPADTPALVLTPAPATAPAPAPAPIPPITPVETPTLTLTPAAAPPTTTPAPAALEPHIPWWVWLIVAVASATTVINTTWWLRHRTR